MKIVIILYIFITYIFAYSFLCLAFSAMSPSTFPKVDVGTGFALTIFGILIGSGMAFGFGFVRLNGKGTVGSYFLPSFPSLFVYSVE